MPITDALKTAADLRKVGFTEEQAAILAEKYEETAQAQSQDWKVFIRAEFRECGRSFIPPSGINCSRSQPF